MRVGVMVCVCIATVGSAMAQQTDGGDPWDALRFFLGTWSGEETATFGDGQGERTYEFIVQGRYLLGRNHSVFPSQDGLPDGDDHEDWTVVSHDHERNTYVLRQFNSEGFVNTFVLEDRLTLPDRMVFLLERSENASGARGSLILQRTGPDAFEETFQVTMPGATEAITIRNQWTRVPASPH